MNSTFRVGIVSMAAILILCYLVFIIGDLRFTEYGYRFVISFHTVNGLTQGSSVSMAGVKIGKVEKIQIIDDQVRVHVYIREKIPIRRQSTFTIGTSGLMGEKFVEIIPTRDQSSPYVKPDKLVAGTDPTRMEELFEQGSELLKKLQGLTSTAKDLVGDPELKQSTRNIFKNAELASKNMNGVIESVREKAESIVGNLDQVLAKVGETIDQNREDLRQIVANMKDFTRRISEISEENKGGIKEIVTNMQEVSEKLDKMIEELNKDQVMTNNLKNTIESLKRASDNAKEITREVKEIIIEKDIRTKIKTGLDDAHKIAQAVDKVFLNIKQTRIDLKYLLRYNKESDLFFSDMLADIYPTDNSFYRVGVEDIGGDPLFNLMLARDAQGKLIKRGGIISSKVGIGFDYQWAEDISYSLDFIDTREPTTRFTSSYLIRPGLKMLMRVDDIMDTKDINFAVEYKF